MIIISARAFDRSDQEKPKKPPRTIQCIKLFVEKVDAFLAAPYVLLIVILIHHRHSRMVSALVLYIFL